MATIPTRAESAGTMGKSTEVVRISSARVRALREVVTGHLNGRAWRWAVAVREDMVEMRTLEIELARANKALDAERGPLPPANPALVPHPVPPPPPVPREVRGTSLVYDDMRIPVSTLPGALVRDGWVYTKGM